MKQSNCLDCGVFVCVFALSIVKKYDFTTQLNYILTQILYCTRISHLLKRIYHIDANVKQDVKSSRLDRKEKGEMRIDEGMLAPLQCLCCWSYESPKGVLHQVHIFYEYSYNLTKKKTQKMTISNVKKRWLLR